MAPNDHYNLTLFTSMPQLNTLSWAHTNTEESVLLSIFLQQPFAIDVFIGRRKLKDSYNVGVTENRLPTLEDAHGTHAFDPHARQFYIVMRGTNAWHKSNSLMLYASMVVQLSMTFSIDVKQFDGPSSRIPASRSVRHALLTPQVHPGSLYRCGRST